MNFLISRDINNSRQLDPKDVFDTRWRNLEDTLFKIIKNYYSDESKSETNFSFFEKKIILFLNINDSRRIAINESFIKITLLIVKTL